MPFGDRCRFTHDIEEIRNNGDATVRGGRGVIGAGETSGARSTGASDSAFTDQCSYRPSAVSLATPPRARNAESSAADSSTGSGDGTGGLSGGGETAALGGQSRYWGIACSLVGQRDGLRFSWKHAGARTGLACRS